MLRASIDLGTNTCLLLIANCDERTGVPLEAVEDHATVVRLGQGIDHARKFHPDAIERTLTCLKKYAERVRAHGISLDSVLAVATSQARDAENGPEFLDRVSREIGFRFKTLSGMDEARFTFLGGLLPGMNPRESAVIDIGGGSTEITGCSISAEGAQLETGMSVDVGAVRYTERYLSSDPVTDDEFWSCREAVDQAIQRFKSLRSTWVPKTQLIAVAGTAATLAQWHLGDREFSAKRIDGVVLTAGDLHRMVEELKWRTVDERVQLPGVTPGRADVLLAGALILWRALEELGFPSVQVSSRGLRYGILAVTPVSR